VARPEFEGISTETTEFSISELVRKVSDQVADIAGRYGSSVCCLLDRSLPDRLIGDSGRLAVILTEFVSTQIKATKTGQVKLSVLASRHGDQECDVTFEVVGNRQNSRPEWTPDEFGPQSGDIRLEFLPKRAVHSLGGEMGVQMEGKGSPTIWIRIPFQLPVKNGLPPKQEQSRRIISLGSASTSSLRILMAEDNLINQRVGKLILQRAGYCIDLVADGNEALAAHQSEPYDLILMDCQMPTMDGFEATRRIRSCSFRQPVIIAVTANALVGERERCLAVGMDDYLSKPFQAEQLVSIVTKWADVMGQRIKADSKI
jgi:CheY-like chemotaxis protein